MIQLEIKNLHVEIIEDNKSKEILKGINLNVDKGNIHALMGPNGSGKSTLANVIMGNQEYSISKGEIIFEGKNITDLKVDEKARLGIFMSFQYPQEIEGVTIRNFLKTAYQNLYGKINVMEFKKILDEKSEILKLDENFSERYLNKGFSGGEKKKSEMLQLAVLNPKFAILDETDSGLDIDALRSVSESINLLKEKNPEMTILIITHYKRILEFIKPDKLSIMIKGKIVMEGNAELVDQLEEKGYGWIEEE
ncbi:MAG: Fe-S cluster assembly ATPase SufC [Nanoarchaeota archaeon]